MTYGSDVASKEHRARATTKYFLGSRLKTNSKISAFSLSKKSTMKFHETTFEEYISAVTKFNLHPELAQLADKLPSKLSSFGNLIVYGPSGIGKYSQVLKLLRPYSPSELKYDKKLTMQNDKLEYTYRISDIHYEIDMALLGCNSVLVWHEVFTQIVDIVSLKQEKCAILVCKNFHTIHNELLDIFYSYMQQYNHPQLAIQLKFVLITEHIGFLPNSILQHCWKIPVKRPSKDMYMQMIKHIVDAQITRGILETEEAEEEILHRIRNELEPRNVLNLKELHWFCMPNPADLPVDIFNVVCDALIEDMMRPDNLDIAEFRDQMYDMLVYNLDPVECIWYIITHFLRQGMLREHNLQPVLDKMYEFLKHFNNNYRPIYHLENILFFFINQVHGFPDPDNRGS
jgi:hypothetical protein